MDKAFPKTRSVQQKSLLSLSALRRAVFVVSYPADEWISGSSWFTLQAARSYKNHCCLSCFAQNIGFGSVGCGRTVKGASAGKLITIHKTFVFVCLCTHLSLYLDNIGFGSVGCGRIAKGASAGKLITIHKTSVFVCLCTHLSLYLDNIGFGSA